MLKRRKKVVLIDPPLRKQPLWDPIRTSQPLGLWSIGSALRSWGHDAEIVCAPLEGLSDVRHVTPRGVTTCPSWIADRVGITERQSAESLSRRWYATEEYLEVGLDNDAILARIEDARADLVGIASLASCMHESVVALAKAVRSRFPTLPIIAGGQHATAMPEALIGDSGGAIDYVVLGEGEVTTQEIVDSLDDPARIRELRGVAWLQDGEVHRNKRRPFVNLQDLPPLDPALMAHVALPDLPAHTYGDSPVRSTDMLFSVGCHRSCPYCFAPIMRGRLRQWSWDQIRAQLGLLREYGYDEIVLQDDDLLKDRAFFLRLIREFGEFGMRWQDNGGMELELLDAELVDAIVDSGCVSIYVPINPRQLADRLPTEEAVRNVDLLRRIKGQGVYTFTSGIYGVPDLQHPERFLDEVRLLRDFHVDLVRRHFVDASLAFPLSALPGTRWFHEASKSQHFSFDPGNWLGYSIFVPQIYPKNLDPLRLWVELIEVHRALNEVQESYPWFSPFPNRLVRGNGRGISVDKRMEGLLACA